MKFISHVAIAIINLLCSCEKVTEEKTSDTTTKKNVPNFLADMAKEYSSQINSTIDHKDDTLIFRCQGPPTIICTLDTFKKKYIDSIALRIGKNVYLGFSGDYSVEWLRMPNGRLVSPANLGNLYFYIYSDYYQLEPDSFYSLININFMYHLTDPPFK